ncbi:hypothetical protein F2P81_018133 [Scophthalmus maximus]|uniref:Uncharacterized protein n=1 Tax=Scophthalmus maximus TaxID=52904 RepID=A0A6A4S9U6_SCOMX|nr:hypothetical protein F2P81_018133 [Scophthalmus maximus]
MIDWHSREKHEQEKEKMKGVCLCVQGREPQCYNLLTGNVIRPLALSRLHRVFLVKLKNSSIQTRLAVSKVGNMIVKHIRRDVLVVTRSAAVSIHLPDEGFPGSSTFQFTTRSMTLVILEKKTQHVSTVIVSLPDRRYLLTVDVHAVIGVRYSGRPSRNVTANQPIGTQHDTVHPYRLPTAQTDSVEQVYRREPRYVTTLIEVYVLN